MIEFSCFIFFWYLNSFFQSIIYYNFDKQKEIQFQKSEGRTNFLWKTLLWFGSIQHIATELIIINIIMSQNMPLVYNILYPIVSQMPIYWNELDYYHFTYFPCINVQIHLKAFISFDNAPHQNYSLNLICLIFGQMNDGNKSLWF